MWAENLLVAVGKGVAGLGPKTKERLLDAEDNAVALLNIVQELKNRLGNE